MNTLTQAPNRRTALLTGAAAMFAAACSNATAKASASEAAYASSPIRRITDAQWKQRLPAAAYGVLRHENTETPGTSALLGEHRTGTFVCRGCDLPLFRSAWKYDSGTGWPSFYTAIKANVGMKNDLALGIPRTEYHCARCLGHQGHVFNDGPRPTGERWCNNGVALRFVPG